MSRIIEDLTGKKYSNWIVVRRTEKHPKTGATQYIVICKCSPDTEKTVSAYSLDSGKSKGCVKCAHSRRSLYIKPLKTDYIAKSCTKKRTKSVPKLVQRRLILPVCRDDQSILSWIKQQRSDTQTIIVKSVTLWQAEIKETKNKLRSDINKMENKLQELDKIFQVDAGDYAPIKLADEPKSSKRVVIQSKNWMEDLRLVMKEIGNDFIAQSIIKDKMRETLLLTPEDMRKLGNGQEKWWTCVYSTAQLLKKAGIIDGSKRSYWKWNGS